MLQKRCAGFLKLLQSGSPDFWTIVCTPGQRLASDVVFAFDLGRIKGGIVNPSRGLVDQSVADAVKNDGRRRLDVDDEVDGNNVVNLFGLRGGPRETIQNERCRGTFRVVVPGSGESRRNKVLLLTKLL